MITVVLYSGRVVRRASLGDLRNVVKCYNPLCTKLVQTRPQQEWRGGRPRSFCSELCRYRWKGKRTAARKHMIRSLEKLNDNP